MVVKRNKVAAIIGLGYVGLPLACIVAKKGYYVYGLDIDKEIVNLLNKGKSSLKDKRLIRELKQNIKNIKATTDFSVIADSDIIIICVSTPVRKNKLPDLRPLKSAVKSILRYLKEGHLVIIESTIAPGTCRNVIKPILEKSGLKVGKDIYLAHCPERIDPGNKKWTIENLPRVVGAISRKGLEKASNFYKSILTSNVKRLSSVEAAEVTKIVENAFRDINIAFVNELAKSFDKLGIDVKEVIQAASTKPFAFTPHWPGCGIGGHCIPIDPYYLISTVKNKGFNPKFMRLAREINDNMPNYTVQRITEGLKKLNKTIKGTKITVLGLAYKANVNDIRESPSFEIIKKLEESGANLIIYDPYLPENSTVKNMGDALRSECLVIITDHDEFKKLEPNKLKKEGVRVIIDGRNCLDKEKIQAAGIVYKGIGR